MKQLTHRIACATALALTLASGCKTDDTGDANGGAGGDNGSGGTNDSTGGTAGDPDASTGGPDPSTGGSSEANGGDGGDSGDNGGGGGIGGSSGGSVAGGAPSGGNAAGGNAGAGGAAAGAGGMGTDIPAIDAMIDPETETFGLDDTWVQIGGQEGDLLSSLPGGARADDAEILVVPEGILVLAMNDGNWDLHATDGVVPFVKWSSTPANGNKDAVSVFERRGDYVYAALAGRDNRYPLWRTPVGGGMTEQVLDVPADGTSASTLQVYGMTVVGDDLWLAAAPTGGSFGAWKVPASELDAGELDLTGAGLGYLGSGGISVLGWGDYVLFGSNFFYEQTCTAPCTTVTLPDFPSPLTWTNGERLIGFGGFAPGELQVRDTGNDTTLRSMLTLANAERFNDVAFNKDGTISVLSVANQGDSAYQLVTVTDIGSADPVVATIELPLDGHVPSGVWTNGEIILLAMVHDNGSQQTSVWGRTLP